MEPLVIVVEDDPMLGDVLRIYLESQGFVVKLATDGATGLDLALQLSPSLVVLDLMLPVLDGWEVCRRLREVSQVPVIMLTARADESDKLNGFAVGADDYLAKPFSMKEFLARVYAVLKRVRLEGVVREQAVTAHADGIIVFPTLVIDSRRHRVERNGETIVLTPKEFDLLWVLAKRVGEVIRREELLRGVWGYESSDDDRTIHTHVNRLRAKLETPQYRYVHTVWGVGYKFEVTPV